MILGPIVQAELVRVARQKRWYTFRFGLGLVLLFLLYLAYSWSLYFHFVSTNQILEHQQLSFVAAQIFGYFATGQGIAVVAIAPVLMAGVIAEEKQRKTLHYLLASQLWSVEIVVGKLISRLILIFLPLFVGLPILVVLGILGGFDLKILMVIYGGTCSVVLFESSIAILVSTLCRRGRDALVLTVMLTLLWMFGPYLFESVMKIQRDPWPERYQRWMEPLNRWLIRSTPFGIFQDQRPATVPSMFDASLKMIELQVAGSLALLTAATCLLRPVFARQEGAPPFAIRLPRKLGGKGHRWRPRRPCGDDPMRWKETHGAAGATMLFWSCVIAAMTILLIGYDSIHEYLPYAWRDLRIYGYSAIFSTAKSTLNSILRLMATALFGVTMLLVAGLSATSINREREEDTWISLISTPLSAHEILGAKIFGSLWGVRPLLASIVAIWLLGLVVGVLHPVGLLISIVQLGAFLAFLVGLGTLISLHSRTTMRAIGLTFGAILFLSLLLPMAVSLILRDGPLAGTSSPPYLFALGMLSYNDVENVFSSDNLRLIFKEPWIPRLSSRPSPDTTTTRAVAIGTFFYLMMGPILLALAYRQFDRLLDRPRRRDKRPPEPTTTARATTATAVLPAGRA